MPDGAIYPPNPSARSTATFPTVIFEVGFSEELRALVHDALLFLEGTGGVCQAAVLIKLCEQKYVPSSAGTTTTTAPPAPSATNNNGNNDDVLETHAL